jgi:hypothetical protein
MLYHQAATVVQRFYRVAVTTVDNGGTPEN